MHVLINVVVCVYFYIFFFQSKVPIGLEVFNVDSDEDEVEQNGKYVMISGIKNVSFQLICDEIGCIKLKDLFPHSEHNV